MACSCLFKQEEERHWLRCWKAMNVTKNGLSYFLTTQIDTLHISALANLGQNSPCRSSSVNHLCDYSLRQKYLTFPGLSLNNTDRSKWCSSKWEYTKSFIHSEGYKDIKSVDDLDLIGVFNIIKNCSIFQNYFSCQLSDRKQVLQQVNLYLYNNSVQIPFGS